MVFLDKYGWPVEWSWRKLRWLRLLIHTRRIRFGKWKPAALAAIEQESKT